MWPFDQLRARRNDRRFSAALVILLGHYLYARLGTNERNRVDEEVDKNLRGNVYLVPGWFWKNASWDVVASERALAMARLNIEPTAHGVTWGELLCKWPSQYAQQKEMLQVDYWPAEPKPWDSRPEIVGRDFWPNDAGTAKAKEFLRSHGLDVPDRDPPERSSGFVGQSMSR